MVFYLRLWLNTLPPVAKLNSDAARSRVVTFGCAREATRDARWRIQVNAGHGERPPRSAVKRNLGAKSPSGSTYLSVIPSGLILHPMIAELSDVIGNFTLKNRYASTSKLNTLVTNHHYPNFRFSFFFMVKLEKQILTANFIIWRIKNYRYFTCL